MFKNNSGERAIGAAIESLAKEHGDLPNKLAQLIKQRDDLLAALGLALTVVGMKKPGAARCAEIRKVALAAIAAAKEK